MLVYIFKSTFCLVLLLGFYHLVLEKEKMHHFNRFYLLGSILFSLIVPSFTITVAPTILETPVLTEPNAFDQFPTNTIPQEAISETINYTQYIIGIYILVSLILCILLSRKVYSLLIKVKRNQQLNYFTATVVLLKERIVPYTFLHYIFINKYTYQTDTIDEQILTHELAHVEQKHSIDVLIIEVLQNLFWFNPIFRYYKKAIQLNHEFLADDAVINSHKNITEYQQVLLNTTAQNNNIYLASNLNYSLTKKRLLMMTTPSSNTKILLKKLLVAPLVAGFIFAFAQRVEAQEILTEQPDKLPKPAWQTLQNGEKITITEDAPLVYTKEKVTTGFKTINGVNYYFVTIGNTTKYYNKNGQLTTRKGKVISNRKAKASTIIPENYVTKTYFNGKVFCEFINDKPNRKDEDDINTYLNTKLKEVHNLNLSFQNGISKKEMKQYRLLFKKGKISKRFKGAKIYKHKDVRKMIALYKAMSKKQQQSVTDIRKVLPPPPPKPRIREVKPVKIEVIKNKNGLVEVIETPTSKSDKKKLKEYKKKHRIKDLVEVVEVKDSKVVRDVKELIEVRELKEVQDERPEIVEVIEVQEIKELEETHEVVELMELKEIPTVVEIQEKPLSVKSIPVTKSRLETIKYLIKTGAKFTYNKKKISARKALRLTAKNPRLPMYSVSKKGQLTKVYFSDTPYVKKTAKRPVIVELQEKPISVTNIPASKSPVKFVKIFARRGAKFTYNKKKISAKRALQLVKSNKKIHIYPVKNKDKSIEIHLSDKPFVKELIKEKN